MSDTYLRRFEGTIMTRTREFSNVTIHHPRQNAQSSQKFTEYYSNEDQLRHQYHPEIYANGYNGENEGYLCLLFYISNFHPQLICLNITFIISLVDVEGLEIFPRSFTDVIEKPYDPDTIWHRITIKNYISRHTLLKEAAELIPHDTLTLSIKICLEELYETALHDCIFKFLSEVAEEGPSFETGSEGPHGRRTFLLLDSRLGNYLKKDSDFFRRKSDIHWIGTGKIEISFEEYRAFMVVESILFGSEFLKFQSIDDIMSLYIVSHRYGMNTMINTMRHFLKDCISLENADDLLRFADFYDDKYLKKAITFFKGLNKESDEVFREYCEIHFPPIDKQWICKRLDNDPNNSLMFDSVVDMPDFHKQEFDFYN